MNHRIADPYAQCEELGDWDLYAVDGHYHHAACFDKKTENSKGELRAIATGHFFRMNMRTHHMSCLGMANPEDGKKKPHDVTVIKRSTAEQLRNGTPKGRKVMLVYTNPADSVTYTYLTNDFAFPAFQRATQRTQRFIRWVRAWIYQEAPWCASITRLREIWGGIYS